MIIKIVLNIIKSIFYNVKSGDFRLDNTPFQSEYYTVSACSVCLNPIKKKMESMRCTSSLFNIKTSLVPFVCTLERLKRTGMVICRNSMAMKKHTYISL